ncbi:MAG: M48 family metalloprotease [Candidatus Omnitrophica bacterium]|nr:M48 family metalloprotease [Candidatus Omnitrophota bacterium]
MKIFIFFVICSFLWIIPLAAVEFDTSTGEEDIVFMSTDGEVNLGDSLAKSVARQFYIVKDADMQEKVEKIGQRIAAVCDRKDIIYHFAVIDLKGADRQDDKPIINAFSIPGGYVYVFKDLYNKAANDDELAGVIAHEVGHIVGRHGVKRMQMAFGANLLMILGSQAQTDGHAGRAFEAINTLMMSYGRDDELFADKMAVKYTKKAEYNPEAVPDFLEKLWEVEKDEPLRPYISQRSHPYLAVRIAKAKEEVLGKMDFNSYINLPTDQQRN